MSNKIISYITLHTFQVQMTQSQSTNTKSSGRAARHPSVEIERKNTVLGFPIEVNCCKFKIENKTGRQQRIDVELRRYYSRPCI